MHLFPLGDQGLLAYCQDESSALNLAERVRQRQYPWIFDIVQAYTSVGFFVDLRKIDFAQTAHYLKEVAALPDKAQLSAGKLHVIPCCYELGLDVPRVAQAAGLDVDEVIRLHLEPIYTVYAIGFCPGFPYLGYMPKALWGVPRLESPRLRVEEGSVGLTGRQTGIYTERRPGGWNIIGRTPLQLVSVAEGYFPLRTGDRVRFRRIDEREFRELAGGRLPLAA
jgi:inhibitor of KinA